MKVKTFLAVAIGAGAVWASACQAQTQSSVDIKTLLNDAQNDVQGRYFASAESTLAMASAAPDKSRADTEEIASIRKQIDHDTDYASAHGGSMPPA